MSEAKCHTLCWKVATGTMVPPRVALAAFGRLNSDKLLSEACTAASSFQPWQSACKQS